MKTIQYITNSLKALSLMAMLLVPCSMMAENTEVGNAASKDDTTSSWQVGDTIRIDRSNTHYLTGERMSPWVYDVTHPILQVGTKRFPNGVLIEGILSWVDPAKGLVLISPKEQPIEEQPMEEQPVEEVVEPEVVETEVVEPEATQPTEETKEMTEQPADTAAVAPIEQEEPVLEQGSAEGEGTYTVTTQPRRENFHRFTFAIRGGYANMFPKAEGKVSMPGGFSTMLDFQYAHYWTKFGRPVDLGIVTGLSVGYAQSVFSMRGEDRYSVQTTEGAIDYAIATEKVSTTNRQIQAEIPILFSLVTEKGLYFSVGPKVMLPLYTPYSQHMSKPTIDAYFPEMDVHVIDQTITGRIDANDSKGQTDNQWKVNILLGAEIGYEWNLHSGDAISLGAYVNYSVYSAYRHQSSAAPLVVVTPPTAEGPAMVTTTSATDAYLKGLGYMDVGIKVGFHFNNPKQERTVK